MKKEEGTNFGVTVKKLRKGKGMSRLELSKAAGISESYLKKIEMGVRKPGIQTYQKMMVILETDIVVKDSEGTVKGDCVARMQKIFMESTDRQVLFMAQVLECMAENIGTMK